jgi:hypothetical protein
VMVVNFLGHLQPKTQEALAGEPSS